jgi:hypothetical protein
MYGSVPSVGPPRNHAAGNGVPVELWHVVLDCGPFRMMPRTGIILILLHAPDSRYCGLGIAGNGALPDAS